MAVRDGRWLPRVSELAHPLKDATPHGSGTACISCGGGSVGHSDHESVESAKDGSELQRPSDRRPWFAVARQCILDLLPALPPVSKIATDRTRSDSWTGWRLRGRGQSFHIRTWMGPVGGNIMGWCVLTVFWKRTESFGPDPAYFCAQPLSGRLVVLNRRDLGFAHNSVEKGSQLMTRRTALLRESYDLRRLLYQGAHETVARSPVGRGCQPTALVLCAAGQNVCRRIGHVVHPLSIPTCRFEKRASPFNQRKCVLEQTSRSRPVRSR